MQRLQRRSSRKGASRARQRLESKRKRAVGRCADHPSQGDREAQIMQIYSQLAEQFRQQLASLREQHQRELAMLTQQLTMSVQRQADLLEKFAARRSTRGNKTATRLAAAGCCRWSSCRADSGGAGVATGSDAGGRAQAAACGRIARFLSDASRCSPFKGGPAGKMHATIEFADDDKPSSSVMHAITRSGALLP